MASNYGPSKPSLTYQHRRCRSRYVFTSSSSRTFITSTSISVKISFYKHHPPVALVEATQPMSQSHSQEAPSSQVSENLEGTGSQQSPSTASSESLSEELQPQASSSRRVVLIDQESTLLATSSEPLSVDLQHQASGSRRVVLIDQEPPLLAASQADTKKPKRKSKSLLKRNQSRLDTHKYLQAHPEVVPEFVEVLKHKEKSSQESSSSQTTAQQPNFPVSN